MISQIKVVDPATKRCTTLAGTGQSGLVDGPFEHAQFSEPGGLCLDPAGRTLFVADTNNHAIRVLDLDQKSVTQVWDIRQAVSLFDVDSGWGYNKHTTDPWTMAELVLSSTCRCMCM